MSSDSTRQPSSAFKFSLRDMFVWIAGIAVVAGIIWNGFRIYEFQRLAEENERLAKELADLKLEMELQKYANGLKAPIEALVSDSVPWPKREVILQEALAKVGIERYPRFSNVYYHGAKDFDLPIPEKLNYAQASSDTDVANGSYEHFWRHYANEIAGRLEGEMRERTRIGGYLLENPAVFRERFRPLLLRLTQSDDRWLRFQACATLIVAGDRTPAVLSAVSTFLAEPKRPVTLVNGTRAMKYTHEHDDCVKLNREFQLNLPESKE